MTHSSWDKLREKSTYHFDPKVNDRQEDVLTFLGHLESTWDDELDQILADARPANWETRGFKGEGVMVPKPELADEVYKLFEDLANLTDIEFNEWIISNHKPHRSESLTRDTFQKIIPLTPEDYRNQNFKSREQLDNLRASAGVSVETQAPKNDFTESLRIAAGIR